MRRCGVLEVEDRMNVMVISDKRTLTNRIDLELRGGNGGKRRPMRVASPVKNKSQEAPGMSDSIPPEW